MKKTNFLFTLIAVFFVISALSTGAAKAQADDTANSGVDILPAKSVAGEPLPTLAEGSETHPPVRLTPDKSELIRLDSNAASIIIGNPAHLSVLTENSKTLILVPRMPGATHFSVLDENGDVIMQRHVIVASPQEKYVRIRRSCATAGKSDCVPTQVYYCPDMCHEINIAGEDQKESDSPLDALADAIEGATEAAGNGGDAQSPPVVNEGAP